ncbi:bifunctional protein-disulfide isomerase/oxidoreductase DsbC [Paraglaciecola sp. L1A13]|uniref:bifunctional protein-disulfide isomerase/oxidoreductase DsbC n=1 Tax=Paraglaciecola sp. L1A13 TaxID=2686359 RepID=UPI00131E9D21|nr:bifunctional protein-disulfide isomerase/oxidoreductase DsbC [Paraglaciecola sp. L1A13]|tara:strand:+ start:204 stop:938 length:735 start_codon:yes stop_codon:yes gene_type:complete
MKYRVFFLAMCAFLSMSFGANAADTAKSGQNLDGVKQKIQKSLGMQVSSIGDSPVPGLLQVQTDKGLFYTSEDGKYLLQARIFNLDEGMRNETENTLTQMRLDGIEKFKDSAIEYKADNEKYVVNVFTDITCGYCRKLHNQMDEYNDLGITVRYLAFPRAGLNSQPYQDMVSVWCSDNPQKALNEAKGGENVAKLSCSNHVADQYNFGQSVGVNGTPNIILPNGSVVPGYQPPSQLLQAIQDAS